MKFASVMVWKRRSARERAAQYRRNWRYRRNEGYRSNATHADTLSPLLIFGAARPSIMKVGET